MTEKTSYKKLWVSLSIPLLFAMLMAAVKIMEVMYGSDLSGFGVKPGKLAGLQGILTSPFIHGDWQHLLNNTVPLLVSGTLLFFFFQRTALKVFPLVFIISGLITWVIGEGGSVHIGASGGVYGLIAFVFFAGLMSSHKKIAAISLLMAFLYGSLIWGLFPIDPQISWEGHTGGAFAGTVLALLFRKQLPQDPVKPKPAFFYPDVIGDAWMTEEQRQEHEESQSTTTPVNIIYIYTPKKPDENQSAD